MKAFAIELPDETVARLMEIWKVKTTAEIRNILQRIVTVIVAEHIKEA